MIGRRCVVDSNGPIAPVARQRDAAPADVVEAAALEERAAVPLLVSAGAILASNATARSAQVKAAGGSTTNSSAA